MTRGVLQFSQEGWRREVKKAAADGSITHEEEFRVREFRADAELRGKWVLRSKPALVESTSPRYGEKASYYSAVRLETGEVEWMELEENSDSETSAAFLEHLRERHSGRLNVIWHNAPAHRGDAIREYLRTPRLWLRLVNLPAYSPDFNGDEAT